MDQIIFNEKRANIIALEQLRFSIEHLKNAIKNIDNKDKKIKENFISLCETGLDGAEKQIKIIDECLRKE